MKEKIQQVLNAIAKNILYLKFYNLFGNSVKPHPLYAILGRPTVLTKTTIPKDKILTLKSKKRTT